MVLPHLSSEFLPFIFSFLFYFSNWTGASWKETTLTDTALVLFIHIAREKTGYYFSYTYSFRDGGMLRAKLFHPSLISFILFYFFFARFSRFSSFLSLCISAFLFFFFPNVVCASRNIFLSPFAWRCFSCGSRKCSTHLSEYGGKNRCKTCHVDGFSRSTSRGKITRNKYGISFNLAGSTLEILFLFSSVYFPVAFVSFFCPFVALNCAGIEYFLWR